VRCSLPSGERPAARLRASLIVLLSILMTVALRAASGDEEGPPVLSSEAHAGDREDPAGAHDDAEVQDVAVEGDPCVSPDDLGQSWLDWLNRTTHRTVCGLSMWVDGYFGDERVYEEYSRTGGWVSIHTFYTQRDQFDARFRFNVRVNLPNLDRRLHAFVGREGREEYLTDSETLSPPGPLPTTLDEDRQLLVGLGWTPLRNDFDALTFRVGVRVEWPPAPYVKAIYRHNVFVGAASSLQWRQTVFWAREDQLGTTTNLDLERRLSDHVLIRWTNNGTISGITDGVEWRTSPTLFQTVSPRNALGYSAWLTGATGAPVQVEEYGARVVYRRRVARDWLFLDVGPTVSWPRRDLEETRETSWGAMIGIEMQFGDRR
jgi:hypothetical protein